MAKNYISAIFQPFSNFQISWKKSFAFKIRFKKIIAL
jgi:hypothetical protein